MQACGKANVPLVSMCVGSALKIAVAYFLIGNEKIGLLGAPISAFACDLAVNAVNFYFINRELGGISTVSAVFIRPYLSAAVAVSLSRLAYNFLCSKKGEGSIITLLAIFLAAVLYFGGVILSGALKKEDVSRLSIAGSLLKESK